MAWLEGTDPNPPTHTGANNLVGTEEIDFIFGLGGRDTLLGLGGDDHVDSGSGPDSVDGGDGNDVVITYGADLANETLVGGTGYDTLFVHGEAVLAELELSGFERLNYTTGGAPLAISAEIFAQFTVVHANTLYASSLILLDPGYWDLSGGRATGFAAVHGTDGADTVIGTRYLPGLYEEPAQHLDLFGHGGDDRLIALIFNDSLDGGTGNDLLEGGLGNDTLDDASGDDTLLGGGGNDEIILRNGADSIDAGEGDDIIRWQLGWDAGDTIEGGAGHDVLRANTGLPLLDFVLSGIEALEFEFSGTTTATLAQFSAFARIAAPMGGAVSTFVAADAGLWDFSTGRVTGFTALQGSSGADTLLAGETDDTLSGGTGEDSLAGAAGNDALRGEVGDDTLSSGAGTDSLDGGTGNDLLEGGLGNDMLDDASGDDTLLGGGGSDEIILRNGADSIDGGEGDDVFRWQLGWDAGDTIEGGAGQDVLRVNSGLALLDFVLSGIEALELSTSGALHITGAQFAAFDTITATPSPGALAWIVAVGGGLFDLGGGRTSGFASVTGSDEAETVLGAAGAETFHGHGGADHLAGAGGADSLSGGSGLDTLLGGEADDALDGGAGADSMIGGAGHDLYIFDDAQDRAWERAGGGEDSVLAWTDATLDAQIETLVLMGNGAISGTGNRGANRIQGNDAANVLNGAKGPDTLAGGLGDDTYRVDGRDMLEELAGGGADTAISLGSFGLEPFGAVEALQFIGSADANGTGNALDNLIVGNGGANRLEGAGGNDTLSGGAGDDTLRGGDGADSLAGGAGNDSLEGGTGNDTYLVTSPAAIREGVDAGTDLVLAAVSFTLSNNIEELTLTGAAAIDGTGNGTANAIRGNSAANLLSGLGGNDRMDGAGGDDTLAGGAGADTLTGGNGADRFRFGAATEGGDLVTDYNARADTILVSAAGFGGGLSAGLDLGATGRFVANETGLATSAAGVGQFVFETDAEALWWDADGAGAAARQLIARLQGLTALAASEIEVFG